MKGRCLIELEAATGREVSILPLERTIAAVDWNRNTGHLIAGTQGGEVYHFAKKPGGSWDHFKLIGMPMYITAIASSPDGNQLAIAAEHAIKIIDFQTHEELASLEGHKPGVWINRLRWSAQSGLLASLSWEEAVNVWDPAAKSRLGQCLYTPQPSTKATDVSWTADGKSLVACLKNWVVAEWNAATQQITRSFIPEEQRQAGQMLGVACHPSKPLVACAGVIGLLSLWSGDRSLCRLQLSSVGF
jgi:WD40 repeat protein